jgi:hypothetical protein
MDFPLIGLTHKTGQRIDVPAVVLCLNALQSTAYILNPHVAYGRVVSSYTARLQL